MELFLANLGEHLVELVKNLGYVGLFFATLIESTCVPIPAEVTMIPAGQLVAQGVFNYWGVLISATLGVIVGSLINYWLGLKFGRLLLTQYGKYMFLKPNSLHKTERFFAKYGGLAVFIGRLLPGIKHYIAFAAGIAKMEYKPFVIFTALGGLIWIWLLLHVSYVAELRAEKAGGDASSIQWILAAVIAISLGAWLIKAKMMKHTDHHDHDPH
jgi:membrane protein DedA with SNARE-associated domain